jgi:hypothetical protein
MVGNMVNGICDSLVRTLNVGGSAGTMGGTMKMTAMATASGMCG